MRYKNILMMSLLLLLCTQAWAMADESRIRELLSGMTITNIQASPVVGWYEVQTSTATFYVDKGARYALFGHLYDLVTHQDLTKKPKNITKSTTEESSISWRSLPKQAAILNKVQRPVQFAVFLDPDCPYCRQLMKDLKTTSYSVAYYLMPLEDLHPESSKKSQQIICSKEPYESLVSMMADDGVIETPVCETLAIDQVQSFSKKHNFYGTPVLIRRDGTVHLGYLSSNELDKWIQQGA